MGGPGSFPAIGKDELIRYFTLTPADEAFLRKPLRPQKVLGAAVQLCTRLAGDPRLPPRRVDRAANSHPAGRAGVVVPGGNACTVRPPMTDY
ncbi:DUF4158 domain-containing protein [Streptomyces sp. NPDC056831]|uniref:DUF4158 domain-containing protein n=1 Tax=Streptomyces sp. NPDC056831 TaxID=3345954 RepID=UPI0036BF03B4